MRLRRLLAALLLVAAGAAAGLLAASARRPAPRPDELDIIDQPFQLLRKAAEPTLLSPAHWLELPMLRTDFDLLADVELGAGAELDLVVRRVEPRPLQGVSLGFQSRFRALRLSTTTAGPPWRTPAQALLGPAGGIKLLAGSPATVSLQVRGRRLRANVAGRVLDEELADDEHGSLVFVVRGGKAEVQSLSIEPVAPSVPLHPVLLGAALGALLAGCGLWRRAPLAGWIVAAAVLPVAADLARRLAFTALPPLAMPDAAGEYAVTLAGAGLSLAAVCRGRLALVLAILGLAVALLVPLQLAKGVAARFRPTPELDALLGPAARETIVELLGQRLRSPFAVHTVEPNAHRVLLLGGQLLWRRGAAPDQHVPTLLTGNLRGRWPAAEAIATPTEDGWSAQQWQLYDRCLRGFLPRVIVFGVPRDEAEPRDYAGPPTTPAALAATVAAVQADCARTGTALVLLADCGLGAEFAAVLRAAARDHQVPLVEVLETDAASGIAAKLATVLQPLLQ